MSKGPCRHKETWWRNEEVAEAVREKKIKYRKWKRENSKEYKKCRQSAKRVICSAKEKKQKECASDLNHLPICKGKGDPMECGSSILWAGVQPTLDPYVEAFYSRPIPLGGEEFSVNGVCKCMRDCRVRWAE